jgi:hypothetical protein
MALRELADVVAELALEKAEGVFSAHGDESEVRQIEETAVECRTGDGLGDTGDSVLVAMRGGRAEMVLPNWMHAE